MTEEQQLIDTALTQFNGDRELAAIAIGRTVHAIECQISICDELRFKHGAGKNKSQTTAEALHRNGNGAPAVVSTDEKELIISITKEDEMLAQGLDRLGLTPEEVQRAVGMQHFGQNQFVESVQIVGATMTTICIQLSSQLREVIERLSEIRKEMKKGPISRMMLLEEEKFLTEALIGMSEQVRRISDTSHRGMLLQAMVRYKLHGGRKNSDKQTMGKPGFSPSIPVESTTQ